MTESATSDTEFSVNEIVIAAYQMAGLLNTRESLDGQDPTLGAVGRRTLEMVADELEVHGVYAKHVDFYDLELTEDTYKYSLPANTLAVMGDGMYIENGQTADRANGETLVKQVTLEEWHVLSAKSAKSRPTLMAPQRTTAQEMWLWPIPDETGAKIRLQIHQLQPDVQDGNSTMPFRRYWTRYFTFKLAHDLAVLNVVPLKHCQYLDMQAASALRWCKMYAKDHQAGHFPVHHPIHNRRRR